LYERVIMAACGLVLSGLGVFFLFGSKIWQSISSHQSVIDLLCVGSVTLGFVLWKGLSPADKRQLRQLFTYKNFFYIGCIFFISLCAWLLSASAFVMGLKFLHIDTPLLPLLSASFMVSFLASLPLSINGGGIREFAAITLFNLCAVPKEASLFTAISIGVFSLAPILIIGCVNSFKKIYTPSAFSKPALRMPRERLEKQIIYFLACSAAVLIFFQIHVAWRAITLNLNIADIFALCGLMMAVISGFARRSLIHARISHTFSFLCAFTMVFALALLIGIYRNGFSAFAFFSKFLGFFVLLGYASLGAFFIKNFGNKGRSVVVRLMWVTLFSIITFRISVLLLMQLNVLPKLFIHNNFMGYAGNRNAFAIQLLTVLSLFFAKLKCTETMSDAFRNRNYWMISFLLMGVYLTFSRSGIITALFLMFLFRGVGVFRTKDILVLILQASILVGSLYCLQSAIYYWLPGALPGVLFDGVYSAGHSDHERWYTIMEGIKLWLQHPFFGSGLGGFVSQEFEKSGRFLVIHNTFIWWIAEFGLVGAFAFFWYGLKTISYLYHTVVKTSYQNVLANDKALLGLVLIFACMGMVHEIFYQRCLWFVWGIIMIAPQLGHKRLQCEQYHLHPNMIQPVLQ